MQSNHIMINTLCNIIIFVSVSSALKCYQCGNYNDGVGSITPCTNYSESIAHLYLRDCQNPSDMFCVKFVNELSTVRDCTASCKEKDNWGSKTFCCSTDGCNNSNFIKIEGNLYILTITLIILFQFKYH